MKPIRVVVADDHTIVREGLVSLLREGGCPSEALCKRLVTALGKAKDVPRIESLCVALAAVTEAAAVAYDVVVAEADAAAAALPGKKKRKRAVAAAAPARPATAAGPAAWGAAVGWVGAAEQRATRTQLG